MFQIILPQGQGRTACKPRHARPDRTVSPSTADRDQRRAWSREALEAQYGQVWDTQQLAHDFEVIGFMAPYAVVRRKLRKEERNLKWLRGIPQDNQLYPAAQELIPLVQKDITNLQKEAEVLRSRRFSVDGSPGHP